MTQRIRLTYQKGEELRYTGNLDMHKVWERTFRRAALPLAYSQGFHPQPRLNQACPLPLGFTSTCEMLDFWLEGELALEEFRQRLEAAVQPGITISEMRQVALNLKPLQTRVVSSVYSIELTDEYLYSDNRQKLDQLLEKEVCLRERRGKPYDLRPLIESIKLIDQPRPTLEMTLKTMPGATGRPEEVLEELGIPPNEVDVVRTALLLTEE